MIGGGIEVVVDPITGKWIPGVRPPSLGRGDARGAKVRAGTPTTLVIVPKDQSSAKVGRGVVPDYVSAAAEGQSVQVPAAGDGLTWVARQVLTPTGAVVEPLQLLHGTRADACVPISAYLVCARPTGPSECGGCRADRRRRCGCAL